ncbi:NAD(P)-binding protein [Phenylobacterium sp.]|jgi:spermidine dehydrogenase|uniref:NAD(P)-binding protein n=1 Tax=Phenylobacterium sp. TaxID=1871053 RepID=UPI003784A468
MSKARDGITRQDFLNGVRWAAGAAALGSAGAAFGQQPEPGPDGTTREFLLSQGITEQDPRYYPPGLTGMRGSHPGSFNVPHALRDGARWESANSATDTGETYDLIIVGAGISGLAAAHFHRKKNPDARILILDNHDDFGGHAKRNEFVVNGRRLIGYGGTQALESLPTWSAEANGVLADLGVDPKKFYQFFDLEFRKKWQITDACFYDKETFGQDKLVADEPDHPFLSTTDLTPENMRRFVDASPLHPQAREDIMRMFFGTDDPLPSLTKAQKLERLGKVSIQTFLVEDLKVHKDVVAWFLMKTSGGYGMGIDGVAAQSLLFFCPNVGKMLGLTDGRSFMKEPYIFHFPDGNASIARLLVRRLIPGSAPGSTMEDIVTARMNYATLDRPSNGVRIRLNSPVVRARNTGPAGKPSGVEITYVRDGKPYRVRGGHAVLACWNMIIPYMAPELPQAQRDALHHGVKVPLVYGTVAIRNWRAFQKLRVGTIYAPNSYFTEVYVDFPVSMGDYKFSENPDQPVLLHLVRTPCAPGLPPRDQFRAGRAELYSTPFETFETNLREQLDRMLGAGGFSSARDIAAITINRWPHGYADGGVLGDPEWPEGQAPHEIGRKAFGRITIANADSGGIAETYCAIDQAHRAIEEIAAMQRA